MATWSPAPSGRRVAQVALERDLAEAAVGAVVRDAELGQHLVHFLARLQAGDPLVLQRVLREVALHFGDAGGQVVDRSGQRFRRDLARLRHVCEVALPDVVHPVEIGFLRLGRRGVEHEGLGGGLVLADLEQVHVDAELVLQAFAEILAIAAQALDQHAAHRVEVDLVGLRGQQVLRLVEGFAEGDDLLAGAAQRGDGLGDLARRGVAAEGQAVHAQHHAFDALVALRGLEHAQHVAQLHLGGAVVADRLADGTAHRIERILLDQVALGVDHQRGALVHGQHARAAAGADAQRGDEEEQQAEEHQVQHQAPGEVHRIPDADQQGGDGAASSRFVHGDSLLELWESV